MHPILHKILTALLAAALAAACVFSYKAGRDAAAAAECTSLQVNVKDSCERGFVAYDEVLEAIEGSYGEIFGVKLDSLDMIGLEQAVAGLDAVRECDAFTTRDGTVRVTLSQKEPVIRFLVGDGGFYATADGDTFPLQERFSADVPEVDGEIPADPQWIKEVISMVGYLRQSSTWPDGCFRICPDTDGNITLIPSKGSERIIFGQPKEVARKFGQLEHYYSSILPAKGEGYYSSVDVRFREQIICRK